MAVIRPPTEEFDRLAEPLDAARAEVASALAALDDQWTVFVGPRLGLERPDFLAVHQRYGVCAIDVLNWTGSTHRPTDEGFVEGRDEHGAWQRVAHPRFLAARQRRTIFDRYFALPGDVVEPTEAVRAAVVMPACSNERARDLLCHRAAHPAERKVAVWGGDGLHEQLDAVLRGDGCPLPSPASIERLLAHVVTAGRGGEPTAPGALTAGQAEIADNPAGARIRRARGASGSGKSVALAARAGRLAAAGRRVLVLSFNVTLANHLRDLVNDRCAEYGADPTLVTCANFHSFCEHVVEDGRGVGIETVMIPGKRLPDSIVACAMHVFGTGFERRYDAVLVDEGQDFSPAWWNLLRNHVLAADGEMLLIADPLQDLYDRRAWFEEARMVEAGFTEPWIELAGSRRMPVDLTAMANRFAHDNVFGDPLPPDIFAGELDPPDGAEDGNAVGTIGRWQNVPGINGLGRVIGREVVRLLEQHPDLAPRDVVFLCEHHHDGEDAVAEIEAAGYPVHHVFSRDPDDPRRNRRYRLWPAVDAVKGCTVHSFKGLGARAVVFGVGIETRTKRTAYVSLTRVGSDPARGTAFLSVINADRRIDDFEPKFSTMLSTPPPPAVASTSWTPPQPGLRVV